MSIRQELNYLKKRAAQGSDLLLLRLRLLNMDVGNQLAGVIRICAAIAVAAVFCLVGLVALLLGLNTVLSDEAKIWVFFGGAGFSLLLLLGVLLWIPNAWRKSNQPLGDTLKAMQQDLHYLLGKQTENHADKPKDS